MSAAEEFRREESDLEELWQVTFGLAERLSKTRHDVDELHAILPMLKDTFERFADNKRQMLRLIGLQHEELIYHERVLSRRTRRTVARRRPPR